MTTEIPARRLIARVSACLIADGADFVSRPVESLALDLAGIVGDHHAGHTRKATSREPWYPRGVEIRNDRQLTVVSSVELAEVALAMEVPAIEPGWIGANLVFADVPNLTQLPSGTVLLFEGGAAVAVERENGPCRIAGGSINRHYPDRAGLDLLFPKVAGHKRGLVASVEKAGLVAVGEQVLVLVPAQRLYGAGPE
jgi:hypothetical protein